MGDKYGCIISEEYQGILYLKFILSIRKTIYVPRDKKLFYGISLTLVIFQLSDDCRE